MNLDQNLDRCLNGNLPMIICCYSESLTAIDHLQLTVNLKPFRNRSPSETEIILIILILVILNPMQNDRNAIELIITDVLLAYHREMGVRHTSLHVLADERHPVLHSVHSESMCHRCGQVCTNFVLVYGPLKL